MGANQSRRNSATASQSSSAIAVGVPVVDAGVVNADAAASHAAPPPSTPRKKLDLVFTMDCTGSMGSYIAAAKQGITRITERLQQAEGYDLRYGLVAYRDHPPQDTSYVTQSFEFTTHLEEMQRSLGTLSANGGGDGPEAVAAALKATNDAEWRDDAAKVVVLIADAPPHGLGERGDGFPNGGPDGVDPLVVLDDMSAKGITIYSVGCQPALSQYRYATEFFIACAERTNGQAVALSSAASLADVILGASIEEMDLEALTHEVQSMTEQLRTAEPTLSDDAVEEQVFHGLRAKGVRTRKVGGSRLQSAHASLVSEAPSLAVAKASLAERGPPPPPSDLGAFKMRSARRGTAGAAAGRKPNPRVRSSSPSSPIGAMVEEEEDDMADVLGCSMSLRSASALRGGAGIGGEVHVKLEEQAIAMEQVSRMFKRGQKKGLW